MPIDEYQKALESIKLRAERRKARKEKGEALGLRRKVNRVRKPKAKSRKWLVREADRVFSLWIRNRDKVSYFSGKPTECCFHIITRSKHPVRWNEHNAVGSTMAENYEMEFNPAKYLAVIIERRGLDWFQCLVRESNRIAKFSNDDLRAIIEKYKNTPCDLPDNSI